MRSFASGELRAKISSSAAGAGARRARSSLHRVELLAGHDDRLPSLRDADPPGDLGRGQAVVAGDDDDPDARRGGSARPRRPPRGRGGSNSADEPEQAQLALGVLAARRGRGPVRQPPPGDREHAQPLRRRSVSSTSSTRLAVGVRRVGRWFVSAADQRRPRASTSSGAPFAWTVSVAVRPARRRSTSAGASGRSGTAAPARARAAPHLDVDRRARARSRAARSRSPRP